MRITKISLHDIDEGDGTIEYVSPLHAEPRRFRHSIKSRNFNYISRWRNTFYTMYNVIYIFVTTLYILSKFIDPKLIWLVRD